MIRCSLTVSLTGFCTGILAADVVKGDENFKMEKLPKEKLLKVLPLGKKYHGPKSSLRTIIPLFPKSKADCSPFS